MTFSFVSGAGDKVYKYIHINKSYSCCSYHIEIYKYFRSSVPRTRTKTKYVFLISWPHHHWVCEYFNFWKPLLIKKNFSRFEVGKPYERNCFHQFLSGSFHKNPCLWICLYVYNKFESNKHILGLIVLI